MAVLQVRWLPLFLLGEKIHRTYVGLTMLSPSRRHLLDAWVTVMKADVIPPEFPTGEIREVREVGPVVIFQPMTPTVKEVAEARWPNLAERVALTARKRAAL